MSDALSRFDGAVAWASLSVDDQATIGAAALEWIVARMGQDAAEDAEAARLFLAAEDAATDLLVRAGDDALPAISQSRDPIPVPSLLGDFCRECHCSHFDPCPEGCGWAEPSLCTVCAGADDDSTCGEQQIDVGKTAHG